MGKTKKSKGHGPAGFSLADQVLEEKIAKPSSRVKRQGRDDNDDEFVNDKLSQKILAQARIQQEELEEEHGISRKKDRKAQFVKLGGAKGDKSESDESDDEEDVDQEEYYENIEIDAEDEKALERFMSDKTPARRTLADIIMEKITEKQTEMKSQMTDNASVAMVELDDRVVNMYTSIRKILKNYRSGKMPKAFKIIPTLNNWEQILCLTGPDVWSAAAFYQSTRLFASNMNAKMAQRFFNLVLLPRVRDDITEYKRLNFHLYMALKKALFKPAAFFKGILLPLCEAGDCTLREAVIISSVLVKTSIPMLHSAAAILKMAEMDYNGANSIFMKTLLDKKYALPYRVIDAVVFHFLGFIPDKRELPVLWHQCLLTFVQRYKEDISSEQKDSLMDLLRAHKHEELTPEIRRELVNSKCRDVEVWEGSNMDF